MATFAVYKIVDASNGFRYIDLQKAYTSKREALNALYIDFVLYWAAGFECSFIFNNRFHINGEKQITNFVVSEYMKHPRFSCHNKYEAENQLTKTKRFSKTQSETIMFHMKQSIELKKNNPV